MKLTAEVISVTNSKGIIIKPHCDVINDIFLISVCINDLVPSCNKPLHAVSQS